MPFDPRSRVPSCALALLLLAALGPREVRANSAPVVTNVTATQIPNTGQVRITFDVADADNDPVTARVICSSNNGANFDLLPVTLSGDVNHAMPVGPNKVILWDAAHDYPGRHWTQVIAKVLASDGPALSGEMVSVPAGSFQMGFDQIGYDWYPVHTVTLDAFSIDKYEVTNAEFAQFVSAGGYSSPAFWSADGWNWRTNNSVIEPDNFSTYSANYPGYPVVGVSYYEAEAYANFVGKRLPTDAEWEKTARGTDQRTHPWGNDIDPSRANYAESNNPYAGFVGPVGFFDGRLHPNPPFQTTDSPSPYGAYDLVGNAWEWVRDWYGPYPSTPVTNPTGPVSGYYRVIRGGSFLTPGIWSSSYLRTFIVSWPYGGGPYSGPTLRHYSVGFRCAKSGS